MADRLKPTESGTRGVRRLLRKQVGKALEAIEQEGPLSDEGVHDVRKRLKKARSYLRLLREALGSRRYRRENLVLRDAARPLTEVRDARILTDALQALAEHFPEEIDRRTVKAVKEALRDEQRDIRQRVLGAPDALEPVRDALRGARDRLSDAPVGRRGWSVLGTGLKRVYRAGRDAFSAARQEASVENLHEWRKQAKYLRYQLEALQPMAPAVLEELTKEAHELGDLLGNDHDLAMLHEKLKAAMERFANRDAIAALLELIDRRRQELQQQAWPVGERLYADRAKQFANRLGRFWHTWRSGAAVRV